MEKIKTAILGYGRSGSTMHAGAVEKLEPFEMTAVCDIDLKKRKQASKRFGCPVYEDYHRMLENENLDLVCVITRSDQHCEMSCDCLNAGVNVLVTKPWAANYDEAKLMTSTAKKTGKKLLPWLPSRWGSHLRKLQELKDKNTAGDIFTIRRTVATFNTRNDWQTESRFAGGYLLNWGPHIIDQAVLLAGGRVKSVYGKLKQTINPGDAEDLFFALITMDHGVLVQAEYTISLAPMPDWVVQGKRGTITIMWGGKFSGENDKMTIINSTPATPDDPTKFKTMAPEDKVVKKEALIGKPYGDTYEIYREIAEALKGNKPFAVTPEDALELSRILDAVRISNSENRVVEL